MCLQEEYKRIEDLLFRRRMDQDIAIECGTGSVTYKEWYARSICIANILEELHQKKNNIAIYIPNSIDYAVAYFGILFSQNIVVPIFAKAVGAEIVRDLRYCEIEVLLTTTEQFLVIRDSLIEYEYSIRVICVDTGTVESLNKYSSNISKEKNIENEGSCGDVALLLHTSGTTSDPKRVMLTHKNILCNIVAHVKSLQMTEEDVGLIALPMAFGYCNTAQFLSYLYVGAKIVIMHSIFHPAIFFNIVECKKITNFTAVPTMLNMLLNFTGSDKYNYKSLKFICFGGGFISKEQIIQLTNRFPDIKFIQTYGQTECSPRVTALLPPYTTEKVGSVGRPIEGVEIKIINNNGEECIKGESGEILVCGENVMKGYYKNPDATNQVIRGKWLFTGDIGYLDEDNFLYLNGRNKNIIISGGINIYPEEVEEVISMMPGVKNVCIKGVNDREMGEIPIAEIVKANVELTETDIIAFCKEKLSFYKIPRRIKFVELIEVTYNGKNKRG